jgi:hypothetical protein
VLIAGEVVFKLYVVREEWGAERLQGNMPPVVAMAKVRFVVVRIPRWHLLPHRGWQHTGEWDISRVGVKGSSDLIEFKS